MEGRSHLPGRSKSPGEESDWLEACTSKHGTASGRGEVAVMGLDERLSRDESIARLAGKRRRNDSRSLSLPDLSEGGGRERVRGEVIGGETGRRDGGGGGRGKVHFCGERKAKPGGLPIDRGWRRLRGGGCGFLFFVN